MYFQDLILTLQKFWIDKGCILLQPYDMEVGAGTSSPFTTLRCVENKPWNVVYAQPCRRPTDGRYAENPNRMQHYYQMQVILKPSPDDIQELCLESFAKLGLSKDNHDFRFVEDDWENPTLGAWGLGWEVWCDGMEVLQFTYMQQIGGVELSLIPGELTYGLERLAMYLQGVNNVWDLKWNDKGVTYADVFKRSEIEYSKYNFEYANTDQLKKLFDMYEKESAALLEVNLAQPALDQCLKAGHVFNVMEARGVISVTERTLYISRIRNLSSKCCALWAAGSE
jgi:glycyl-tRNA synthetase alpha chain